MREFKPNSFGLNPGWFADVIEARLSHSGEYVNHIPSDGEAQSLVMNYQHIPVNEDADDYLVPNTNPTLYGFLEHFETKPANFKEGARGTSVKNATGSKFEIRGILFNAKKVDVNHRGYVQIELVKSDNCQTPRPEFKDEMEAFLCSKGCS